jgi:hypothetical protein
MNFKKCQCEYIKKEKLAGAMIWTLGKVSLHRFIIDYTSQLNIDYFHKTDMDDFNGSFCDNGAFPLINKLAECFRKFNQIETTKSSEFVNEPEDYHDFDEIMFDVVNNNAYSNHSICKILYLLLIFLFNVRRAIIFS